MNISAILGSYTHIISFGSKKSIITNPRASVAILRSDDARWGAKEGGVNRRANAGLGIEGLCATYKQNKPISTSSATHSTPLLLHLRDPQTSSITSMAIHNPSTVHSSGLLSLPEELLLGVAEFVVSQRDLTRPLRISRKLHVLFRDLLQKSIEQDKGRALMWAVRHNYIEVAYRMIRLRADAWAMHHTGVLGQRIFEAPLERAVRDGNLRLVRSFTGEEAQKTTDILMRTECKNGLRMRNETPLCLALKTKNAQIAHIFINKLERVNQIIALDRVTLEKKTVLHMACDNRLIETTRYLMSRGADPNWEEKGGYLRFHCVKRLSHQRRLSID